MVHLSKSVLAVSGAVLAAGLIGFTNPKTVHAVAAALVEVTNTTSNPVPTSDVSRSASQIVAVYCDIGGNQQCYAIEPGGGLINNATYTVPAGQNLVITEIQIQAPPGTGISDFFLQNVVSGPQGDGVFQSFAAPNDGATHLFQLSQGIVWPSGGAIRLGTDGGTSGLTVYLRGYLTPN